MATNLAIDDALIDTARELGHHRTKREAVTCALEEYILRLKQHEILADFGTVEYDKKYEFMEEGDFIVLRGGQGGLGNENFKSA